MSTSSFEPHVIYGPRLRVTARLKCCCDNGPRVCIKGRWLSPLLASRRLYVSRKERPLSRDLRQRKLWRFRDRLQGDASLPF
ncbi:hypothetical protein SNE35_22750 [Paucibacter sp. R3-3]|uniref:Uncharacterized protein n=1 Tax=Roseateles agri TaxID=3098619 RepID=A0ABU5DM06_9BURK|nr:hypothetical protein [Paucibacter sp. R3-3]MDY0747340.1 hypothetical protein [Paucibacter sp. R3-3]